MSWMLYGANGYTGRLILRKALDAGESPILAGRNAAALQAEATDAGLEWRDFDVTAPKLGGVTALLNAAGPFETTGPPLMQACIGARIPYLDIAGEYPTFLKAQALDDLAKSAGVTLLPGVGLAVLPTDCLAVKLARELPTATNLQIAVWTKSGASRGTLKAVLPLLATEGRVCTNGILRPAHFADKIETFDFGNGKPEAVPLYPWRADVVTAGFSTHIPTIECFVALPRALETAAKKFPGLLSSPLTQKLLGRWAEGQPIGPTREQRAEGQSIVKVRARVGLQKPIIAGLSLGDPYEFTAISALAALKAVLTGSTPPGFQTPGLALGPEFVLGLPGVTALFGD
jgi:short subunit dehydrogenase-like uncharacterized protein